MRLLRSRITDSRLLDTARLLAENESAGTLYWFNHYYEIAQQSGSSVRQSVIVSVRNLGLMGQLLARLDVDHL